MKSSHKWPGDLDMRIFFNREYLKYFSNVFEKIPNLKKYDLIISDDNRNTLKTDLENIYRKKSCELVAFEHGNSDNRYFLKGLKKVFDRCFVFGKKDAIEEHCIPGGIPANDKLSEYLNITKEHILVIVNFLGNRPSPFKLNFDKNFFYSSNLNILQKYYNLPVVIKLKSRSDEIGFEHNAEYLRYAVPKDLDYTVVMDVENDNKLIAQSKCVISAPSTMAFKPIQLGIPTVLIKGSGQEGSFYDYEGLLSLQEDIVTFLNQERNNSDWIERSIEGGLAFQSTESVIKGLNKII